MAMQPMHTTAIYFVRLQKSGRRAFSLLELLAVVTIMGIMAAVILPRLSGQAVTAKSKVCTQYVGDINSAIEKYNLDNGVWPTSVNDLQDERYYPAEIPVCPVTNAPYVIDSTKHTVLYHNH
jgi:prepilin-type N-terminal cleavage/methylation domain-containing protein